MTSLYHSTRSTDHQCTAKRAVLNGIAPDGGLYVTDELGAARFPLDQLASIDYKQISHTVLSTLLDDYTSDEMAECVEAAYGNTFETDEVSPLVKVGDAYILELFHGPTSAFKDVALQMLPQLMSRASAGTSERIMILTATSGDTGKAALAGFSGTPGLGITVFYPHGGTSEVQRLQMATQEGSNVAVCAVEGNFDDAQSTVKQIFGDEGLRQRLADKGIVLSSANSINIGRLAPQVAYYFSAYSQLLRAGEISLGQAVDFCVPTGNFGDVLAGYFAHKMGLPVRKFIVASNKNNILTDFLTTGVYDRNRPFFKTASPSMDILISSNLERLLYYACEGDSPYVAGLMEQLGSTGRYEVTGEVLARIQALFDCGWADDQDARDAIESCYEQNGYLMDTHTAVAWKVSQGIAREDGVPRIVLSTASPFKFCREVCASIGLDHDDDDFACMDRLQDRTGLQAPAALAELRSKPVRFEEVIARADMASYVENACATLL